MADAGAAPARPRIPTWPLYRAMVGVGLICGAAIVGVYLSTKPIIAENRARALQAAVLEVLPDAETSRAFDWTAAGTLEPVSAETAAAPAGPGTARVHAGYGADGALAGVAVEAAGMGYADTIRVLYGLSLEKNAIVGMAVLESKETPGLGDKIEIDSGFRENFEALDVTPNAAGDGLANPIAFVKHGEKTEPWQIDGITGATISSRAIADMLRKSAAAWVPRLAARRDVLRDGAATEEAP